VVSFSFIRYALCASGCGLSAVAIIPAQRDD
jgi:hypothetical protein